MLNKDINIWAKEIHSFAKAKGWWNLHRTREEIMEMIQVELSDATKEVKFETPLIYQARIHKDENGIREAIPGDKEWDETIKPEGQAIELIDASIRLLDYACWRKISMDIYPNYILEKYGSEIVFHNRLRPLLTDDTLEEGRNLTVFINCIIEWCNKKGLDFEKILEIKMQYNKIRTFKGN